MTIADMHITQFDVENDLIYGTADAGASVQVCANISNGCITRWVTAAPDGTWMADFHTPGGQGEGQATVDLQPGSSGWAAQKNGLGYQTWWDLVHASEHGVPQLRPRFVLVAIKGPWTAHFQWPAPSPVPPPTAGQALHDLMAERGWPGADAWREHAHGIAPTIVGGSKKHGGPDLGPTRAREAWKLLGVNGLGVAHDPPGPDYPLQQLPKLTTRMVARIQGFPDSWEFSGRKTAAYRQVGNAFPPPVARALGEAIRRALEAGGSAPHATGLGHHASLAVA
jgi:hypothetical protein